LSWSHDQISLLSSPHGNIAPALLLLMMENAKFLVVI